MAIKHSVRNSCLLITFLYRAHKHQLWDFFNSYRRYHSLSQTLTRHLRVTSSTSVAYTSTDLLLRLLYSAQVGHSPWQV
jgi:hypothetical protein